MPAFVLSAFADEIDPNLDVQLAVLADSGVKHIELRSVWQTNVLDLSPAQLDEIRDRLRARGMGVSAIGSPIGKVKITDPWEPHLARFQLALERARFFNVPRLRIFSFYPGDDGRPWSDHRSEVVRRLRDLVTRATAAGVTLLHENEHRIYGEAPAAVADLFTAIDDPHLRAVYDPGNYVHGGHDPWQGWQATRRWTTHFHIKDWIHGETHGRLAGTGQGRIAEVLADAASHDYQGFVTLEPHLRGGGPTGGYTGADLFPAAVAALRRLLPPGTEVASLAAVE
ncbi:MAG TPA: sugar phosphate isomerase/epimerase family protein [Gemmatales bacterium]|nr:sugar phosphate isomerase/epimerase family protein [Gemmatales bacterium]HMP59223.1 sugar phosphate isomerase/epimerase family protein [Gemmatales bacterium]